MSEGKRLGLRQYTIQVGSHFGWKAVLRDLEATASQNAGLDRKDVPKYAGLFLRLDVQIFIEPFHHRNASLNSIGDFLEAVPFIWE